MPVIASSPCACALLVWMVIASTARADDSSPKRLLLLGQGPDGHPPATHEYLSGLKVLRACLAGVPGVRVEIENADEPWADGPARLAEADGVVLFLSEGGKWCQADPRRFDAFTRLAARGGAIAALHWGMGAKDAAYVAGFQKLLGGCHGGPDRRYAIVEQTFQVVDTAHPIAAGVKPLKVRDEFYFRLKFVADQGELTPIITVPIEGRDQTVAWAWQRPDGGRSFGFSGLHFHDNWRHAAYRRLAAQGVLWTLNLAVPRDGLKVDVPEELFNAPSAADD